MLEDWFKLDARDPASVGNLARALSNAEAVRLREMCVSFGGDVLELYRMHVRRWPKLTHQDGKWDLMTIGRQVFTKAIDTGLVNMITITELDIRLCHIIGGSILSTAQFALAYGKTIQQHLTEYVDKTAADCSMLIQALSQPLREASVTVVDRAGAIGTILAKGPEGVPSSAWSLPNGSEYLLEEEESD